MIKYTKGYKYQLARKYTVQTPVKRQDINLGYFCLKPNGMLTIEKGYAWDGPSGPAIDTRNFMRSSLVHDVFYQLMRYGFLDRDRWRDVADRFMYRMNREDGMGLLRAWWVYWSLRLFAKGGASKDNIRKIITAPKGRKK